jgi:protein-L-isoaspartate(D-aspartate) O-methyltransferase
MRVQAILALSLLPLLGSCTSKTTESINRSRDNPSSQETVLELHDPQAPSGPKMNEQLSEEKDFWSRERFSMVDFQIRRRGIRDERVLTAMTQIPRHLFVPESLQSQAYDDHPLPIGHGQTISQPYIVALMTELVRPEPGDRALDIGTGCGYQAAVLSELVQAVYSIEIVKFLATQAEARLRQLGHTNVEVRFGDGYQGWLEHAPFQIIIVAAAPDHIPQPLLDQLSPNGRMVIPVGRYTQELQLIEKSDDGTLTYTKIAPVSFVPMTGIAEKE